MSTVYLKTPVGYIEITSTGQGVQSISIDHGQLLSRMDKKGSAESLAHAMEAKKQISAYFSGKNKTFSLNLDTNGTEFQRKVWNALRSIPFGETRSYGQIADAIGVPGGARAVGLANNRNPLAIVVPCHRVIGANGQLTGYRGGLEIKRWLLNHECQS